MEMRGLDLNKVNRMRRHNQKWFEQKLPLTKIKIQFFVEKVVLVIFIFP